jgi:hypothetical protein
MPQEEVATKSSVYEQETVLSVLDRMIVFEHSIYFG